ncbi:MAG: hypothetical protein MJY67_04130 [Bacteroidales bacterium]|nr:hypothetical protein [Bacteroidales bacterium]
MKSFLRICVLAALAVSSVCACTKVKTIYIQPYNNTTHEECEALRQAFIEKALPILAPDTFRVEILPVIELDDRLKNDQMSRYRADKINRFERKMLRSLPRGCTIVGLMHQDISCTKGDVADYGILGLSFRGDRVCVISTYRLSRKVDLWKLMMHEFIHSYYDYAHCPDDCVSCIMKNAYGKPDFPHEYELCPTCRHALWGE